MNKTIRLALGLVLGATLFGAAPVARAQDDVLQKNVSTLKYEQTDVREALRALFKAVGNPGYSIDPAVQGTITVNLTNVTFEVALNNILRQVDATYRLDGGIFQIIRREIDVAPPSGTGTDTVAPLTNDVLRRIQINYADPQLIALLIGSQNGSQSFTLPPELSAVQSSQGGGLGGGGFGGGMGGMGGGGMGGFGGGGMGGMGGGGMGGFGGGGMGGGGMGGFGGGGMGGGGGFGGGGRGGF